MPPLLSFRLIAPVRLNLPTQVVASNGAAQVGFGPPEAGEWWQLQEISISSTTTRAGTLTVYIGEVGQAENSDYHSQTRAGAADTWSAGGSDTYVFQNEVVTLVWTGMGPKDSKGHPAVCYAKVHYRRLKVIAEPERWDAK